MRNPTFLTQSRHGVFYFRWSIPKEAHPYRKRTTVKTSLGTRTPHKALQLSRYLAFISQTVTEQALAENMEYIEMRRLLKSVYARALADKKAKIDSLGRLTVSERQSYQSNLEAAQEALNDGDFIRSQASEDKLLTSFVKQVLKENPVGKLSPDQRPIFREEFRKTYLAYFRELLEYDASFEEMDLSSAPAPTIDHSTTNVKPAATLEAVFQKYIAEGSRKGVQLWTTRVKQEKHDHFDLLCELWDKDADIRSFTETDAYEVKELLLKLPKHRSKRKETRNLSIREACKVTGLECLNVLTVNKYLGNFGAFFKWARKNKFVDDNIFSDLQLPTSTAEKGKGRNAFSVDHVQAIIDAVIQNRFGDINKDFRKWGVLIGTFTGARRGEVCQLQVSNIRQEQGTWCFDINDEGENRSLKTQQSRRLIPVHQQLIDLGFIEYVKSLHDKGQERLFPTLSYHPKHGWGRALGNWFNGPFLKKLNLNAGKVTFHSLRHSFETELANAGVDKAQIDALMGHIAEGTGQVYYNEGYRPAILREAINKLPFVCGED